MGLKEKLMKWWYFRVKNATVRKGEAGGFRWRFRRFSLEVETLSGNWKARWTADVHPYAYLSAGDDDQVHGFAERLYMISKLLTTDQKFVDDIDKAFKNYEKRLQKAAEKVVVEDEVEEKAALEFERQVQEHVELPEKERKRVERGIDRRFKKAVKEVENEAED